MWSTNLDESTIFGVTKTCKILGFFYWIHNKRISLFYVCTITLRLTHSFSFLAGVFAAVNTPNIFIWQEWTGGMPSLHVPLQKSTEHTSVYHQVFVWGFKPFLRNGICIHASRKLILLNREIYLWQTFVFHYFFACLRAELCVLCEFLNGSMCVHTEHVICVLLAYKWLIIMINEVVNLK